MGKGSEQPSDIARKLAALRRKVEASCVVCGKVIRGTTKRRYCSDACRMRAYRRRKQVS